MEYIAPLILLVVLFVAFGLAQRRGRNATTCAGCNDCADKPGCRHDR